MEFPFHKTLILGLDRWIGVVANVLEMIANFVFRFIL
jgi:hypothetical protein